MCHKYPDCVHAGPVHEKVPGLARHCETVQPNHTCQYLALGCRGCTWGAQASVDRGIILPTMLSMANLAEAARKALFEISRLAEAVKKLEQMEEE